MINWMAKAERRLRIEDMIGGATPMNAFGQFLADTREELAGTRWRQPIIDVADTMYVCKKWFEGYEVAFTASHLLAMTRLVLEREQATREEKTSPDEAGLIRDAHNAMRAARRSQDLPTRDQAAAKLAATCACQAAITAFAKLNGWRPSEVASYGLSLLGRGSMSWRVRAANHDCDLLDHCVWFREGRRYVAAVGQPYLSAVDIADERARLEGRGLVLRLPSDPFAPFHYPGWTLFVVVTRPGVEVQWLPEQDGRLKGLWRDWINASPDYRADAAAALLEATQLAQQGLRT
jgi:hypothetical protein